MTMVRFFSSLRQTLDSYQADAAQLNPAAVRSLLNSNTMQEMCKIAFVIISDIIQNSVTQPQMRGLVQELNNTIQSEYSLFVQRKIALFIVFLIVFLIAFIIIWLPFLNDLNYQIYKTKLMLMIIPLEILMKIKNVGKVLQSQAFMNQNKGNKKRKGADSK